MKYQAAPFAPFTNETAQHIGEMLEALGRFTPEDLVNLGRDPQSVLHPYFEWDNATAAEQHRVQQARQIVNHIYLTIETNGHEIRTKAFHHVTIHRPDGSDDDDPDTYVTVRIARQNDELKTQILQKALSELKGWQRRYADYAHIFGELFDAIDKAVPQVESRMARVEPMAMNQMQ